MNAQTKVEASPHVYQAIAEVQGKLAKVGIAKNRKNQQPGANYSFRGIDDVYAALSPLLAEHRLCVIPRVLERVVDQRATKSGGLLFNVTVRAEFDFVSAVDGTTHTAATFGEAMDSSDKATNKAMSAAYKYAAFMTFAIPTEGDNDADATHHEVAVASAKAKADPAPDKMPSAIGEAALDIIRSKAKEARISEKKILDKYGLKDLASLSPREADETVFLLNERIAKMNESAMRPQTVGDILEDSIPY